MMGYVVSLMVGATFGILVMAIVAAGDDER